MGPENRAVSLETRIRLVLECLTRALLLLLTRAGGSEPGKEGEEGYAELEVGGVAFGDLILTKYSVFRLGSCWGSTLKQIWSPWDRCLVFEVKGDGIDGLVGTFQGQSV